MTLKVVESKTWYWYSALFFLIVLAMAVSAWYGWHMSGVIRMQLEQQVTLLTEENQYLKDNVSSNELQLTELGRSEQMAKANVNQTGLNFKVLEEDKKELEKELSFYRSIMAPELEQVGLNIQNIDIVDIEKGLFEYSLTLTQVKKQDWYLKGDYKIELLKDDNGKEIKLTMKEMIVDKSSKPKFSFRYFQTLSHRFQLPDDFKPQTIIVSASTKNGKQRVTKRFPWVL